MLGDAPRGSALESPAESHATRCNSCGITWHHDWAERSIMVTWHAIAGSSRDSTVSLVTPLGRLHILEGWLVIAMRPVAWAWRISSPTRQSIFGGLTHRPHADRPSGLTQGSEQLGSAATP